MPVFKPRLKPTLYALNTACSTKCTLNPANLERVDPKWPSIVHQWYEQGLNDFKMEDRAREEGLTLSHGAIGRHRRVHLTAKDASTPDETLGDLDDVEALDLIIKRGQTQINNWKLTPSEFFKAMEMKYKLTQGSTMDAMFSAMAAAAVDRDEGPVDPSAVAEPAPLPPEEEVDGRDAED